MSRSRAEIGDVILIPAAEDQFVIAVVQYASEYFKDVVLLGLYELVVGSPMDVAVPVEIGAPTMSLYTSYLPVRRRRWPYLGETVIAERNLASSLRIVAGEVWEGETLVRTASDTDFTELPRMSVLGAKLVERRAAKVAAKILNG